MNARVKTWLAALSLGSTLVVAPSGEARADSVRWPWERREADRPDDRRDRNAPPPRGPTSTTTGRENGRVPQNAGPYEGDHQHHDRCGHGTDRDRMFLDMMYTANAEEIVLADETRRATRDREVRYMAERVIAELSSFQSTLERRAAQLDYRLRPVAGYRLDHRGHAQDDLAWMRASMDIVASYRPQFADYKGDTDRAFASVLRHHWDDMVDRRDDIKALHDHVRNEDRRRNGGHSRGHGKGHGKHGHRKG